MIEPAAVTVTVNDPVTPSELAVMLAVPALTPVTRPALTDATAGDSEAQVAVAVMLLVETSLRVPVEVSCTVWPV